MAQSGAQLIDSKAVLDSFFERFSRMRVNITQRASWSINDDLRALDN
jgi:hypothetical protein